MQENKLKPNDAISLAFANYCYKHNRKPNIQQDIAPTLITKDGCAIAIVERG